MSDVDWWTRGLAIYGSALATASSLFQLYKHVYNRAGIVSSWEFQEEIPATSMSGPVGAIYRFIATSKGDEIISLRSLKLTDASGQHEFLTPWRVDEFEQAMQRSDQRRISVRWPDMQEVVNAKRLAWVDTQNREWPFKKQDLKSLRKHYFDQVQK